MTITITIIIIITTIIITIIIINIIVIIIIVIIIIIVVFWLNKAFWWRVSVGNMADEKERRSMQRAYTREKAQGAGPASISAAGARQHHKITAYPDGFLLVEGIGAAIRDR